MKKGDTAYFISNDDSEIECYILEKISDELYKVKIRLRDAITFKKESELTQIFPDYWETLDENIENHKV